MTLTKISAPILAAMLVASASPSARAACPAETTLALDVIAELGDPADDAAMREYVRTKLPERLDDLCVDESAPRRIEVVVAWSNAARGDYAIALRALPEHGDPFEPDPVDCPGCATAEVLDAIAAQVPLALEGLRDETEPVPATETVTPIAAPRADAPSPSSSRSDRPRLSRLGHAGIGLAATSAASIVAGAVLWARGFVPHPSDSGYRLQLAPAGITLVSAGILGLAAGGTMIGIDAHRQPSRRVALHPSLGRTGIGMAITGRF